MDAVTIRRMIVFGVCSLGVAALYLVPSVAGPSFQATRPHPADETGPRPSRQVTARAPQGAATGVGQPVDASVPAGEPTRVRAQQPDPAEKRKPAADRPTDRPRTAFDPDDEPDDEPPAAVSTISPAKVTTDELTLSWPAASDNRRVIGYRIWLNGYEVATTAETRATVPWFNDDEGQHVVQIKAIDAAGNQSATWSTLLVTRPMPKPTTTPSTTLTPTPTPEPTESASEAPQDEPTVQAGSGPDAPAPKPTATGQ